MRRLGRLFEQVVALPNLWGGWRDFRRGKRSRPSVLAFEADADRHIVRLAEDLAAGGYRPGAYRLLLLHEPKRRVVAAAPIGDRVVHHAVHRVLAPRLDTGLIDESYACLPGRGTHRALLAFLASLRRHRFVLHLDIRHYFLSIDRGILLAIMARRIKDPRFLELLATIAHSGEGIYRRPQIVDFLGLPVGFPPPGCGLPIGNLTSQWWGNHYLSGLDHFIKRELKVSSYQRYMDDLVCFGDSHKELESHRERIAAWLWSERRLRLKRPNASVRETTRRLTYLGARVSRAGIAPRAETLQRLARRIVELALHGDDSSIQPSLASYRGVVAGVSAKCSGNARPARQSRHLGQVCQESGGSCRRDEAIRVERTDDQERNGIRLSPEKTNLSL